MLRLFCASIAEAPECFEPTGLSEYRRGKLKRVSDPELRRLGIAAELLLNHSMRAVAPDIALPLDIVCKAGGKPHLRNGRLYFNLSHSGDRVLCGVSDADLGVDIQKPGGYNSALPKRFFAADEAELLREASDAGYEFARLWTLKESYIKAVGKGLALPLSAFSLVSGKGTEGWHFAHSLLDGYHVAVCSREPVGSDNIEIVKLL